ncbi:MAG: hypothetical protein WA988_21325 [Candidatus Nanopelagicales bacterium]
MNNGAESAATNSKSSASTFRRVSRAFNSERSQRVQIRLSASILFVLGVLLAFNSNVFEFVAQFTDHPEILPGTLLIPYVYLVFQVVLWHLDRDEEAELEEIRFEERRRDVPERILERRTAISSFDRGMAAVPGISAERFATQISEWMAERADAETIEVLMLSYSSETLLSGCLAAAREIQETLEAGYISKPPTTIEFKLLTRDLESPWRFPFLYEQKADSAYRRKLKGRFSQHLARWKEELPEAFDTLLYRHQLSLDIRYYPFEPLLKGVVVRSKLDGEAEREVGLIGIYSIHSVREGGVEGVDYHGWGSVMHRISKLPDATATERVALDDFVSNFDEIWTKYSRADESM